MSDGNGHAEEAAADKTSRRRARLGQPSLLVALGLVIVLAGAGLLTRSSGSLVPATSTATTQQLVTVTRGAVSNTVSAQGTVAAANTANLSFTAAGTIAAVSVKAGDAVTTGQLLATMNSAQLQAAAASAAATVTTAQAKLTTDQGSGASAEQLAADQTALNSDNDALTSAQQALAGASLVAPFNGTVSQVNVTAGQQLGSGGTSATTLTGSQSGSGRSSSAIGSSGSGGTSSSTSNPAIQVITQGSYSVNLPISSADIANVAVGQSVTLTVTTAVGSGSFGSVGGGGFRLGNGGGGASSASSSRSATGATATGTVSTVAKVATASSGVAQYPVAVSFSAPTTGFFVGASVIGAIAINAVQNVLVVPVAAVTTNNGASTVVIATSGKVPGPTKVKTVRTGATANGLIEITSGLQEGQQVVVTTATVPSSGTATTVPASGSSGGTTGTGRTGTGRAATGSGG